LRQAETRATVQFEEEVLAAVALDDKTCPSNLESTEPAEEQRLFNEQYFSLQSLEESHQTVLPCYRIQAERELQSIMEEESTEAWHAAQRREDSDVDTQENDDDDEFGEIAPLTTLLLRHFELYASVVLSQVCSLLNGRCRC